MKVLGVVTARGGSKRIPGKNLHLLGGVPLLCHCLRAAKASRLLGRLVVSTDDEAIASVAASEGAEIITRPAELAQDNTPTLPVIKHAVTEMDARSFFAEIVLTIQPTYPFVTAEDIDSVIRAFDNGGNFDSATTLIRAPFKYHPFNARTINSDGTVSFMFPEEKKKCFNSQSAPSVFFFGNLYASKRSTLFGKNSLYGDSSFPLVIDSFRGFDIDDMADMEMAEWLLQRRS